MAHIKPGVVYKSVMPRQQFIRVPPQNATYMPHQSQPHQHRPIQLNHHCNSNHQVPHQNLQPPNHQHPGNYQFIPYSVNNQSVVIRHPVQQHSFQDAQRNFINNQHGQHQHHHHQQSTIMPSSFSPAHHHNSMPSPYSNSAPMSPFYEDPIPSSSSGRCSIPLGSNDRPLSVELMSLHSQPSSPYVPADTRVDHNYIQPATPDYYSSVVSPSPLYHYENTDPLPAVINQQSSYTIIEAIAQALMRSAETLDPAPIKLPPIFVTRCSVDSADSMPELESVSDASTLSDLLEIIERDIQETYMQQHVPIIPVQTQRVKVLSNDVTVRQLLEPADNGKTIDFTKPTKRTTKSVAVKKFQCIVCKKHFAGGSHLRNHFKTAVHKNEVLVSQMVDPVNMPETWKIVESTCGICGVIVPDDAALKIHTAQFHGGNQIQVPKKSDQPAEVVVTSQGPSVLT